jgi:hypothetical protein
MRTLTKAILASLLLAAQPALAEDNLVVVELFTSQGCSSCPPADDIFAELAQRDDVLALALHVDYWDYIGWTDDFASPAFTARQKSYARFHESPSVYTPQMIVEGSDVLVGAKPMKLAELIERHGEAAPAVRLAVMRIDGKIEIAASDAREPAPMVVDLVTYVPHRSVSIARGENAGRTLDYHNIVSSWTRIGVWNGKGEFRASVPLASGDPAAVIVQKVGPGEIVAAARAN